MMSFKNLELPDFLVKSLDFMGITEPTPIQANAIPPGLEGKDILASAQTGTGKTLAYLVPLITRMLNSPTDTALVLTPTRELAMQVKDAAQKLLHKQISNPVALLIGGDSMRKQLEALKKQPRIIVGTPGRINDHLSRNSLKLQKTHFFVIDEADRMLDMGFEEDLEKIIYKLPKERQTFMFSATMPVNIVKLSQKYLTDPQRISLGSSTEPSAQINQQTIHTTVSDKFTCLLKEIEAREGSIIIFVKTKIGAENLAEKLKRENLNASKLAITTHAKPRRIAAIHGDLRQSRRNQVISAFRDQKLEILVATDVAARGLDIHHVRHVINYDLPQCPDDYIHRIGRTGRAGLEGEAISLLVPADKTMWRRIDAFINQKSGVHPSNESFQKRGRGKPSQKTNVSFRGRPSARFQSEGRRFAGGSSSSEGKRFGSSSERPRFAGGFASSEGRRFANDSPSSERRRSAGGFASSEGRRFAHGSPSSERRRFAGGGFAPSSEGRRFGGGSSQTENRPRFAPNNRARTGTERVMENDRFQKDPRKKNRFRTAGFDTPSTSHFARSPKSPAFPKISFKSKTERSHGRKTDSKF